MKILPKIYCRAFQSVMKVAENFLNFREPILLDGLQALPSFIKNEEKLSSILIVTDDFLHNKSGLIDNLKKELKEIGISFAVYDKTVPNPTIDNIEEALVMYKDNNCRGIIAVGGGSPMDCAKGVACRVARPNKTIPQMRGVLKVRKQLPPLFAVPTTAGTGSEATISVVISNSITHEKYAINDTVCIPKYAVLDPKLTVGLPKHITSTTGMDALTHAIEAYIGYGKTKKTDEMARKATKLIFENILKAYSDGTDIEARKNMQLAAFYAGIAFTRAEVGYIHAVAHTLGGYYHVPHGLANAIILPHVLDMYYGSAYERKMAELADLVGVQGENNSEKCKNFIKAIRELNTIMQIPEKIEGIKDADLPQMVKNANREANPLYAVPNEMDKSELLNIYKAIRA